MTTLTKPEQDSLKESDELFEIQSHNLLASNFSNDVPNRLRRHSKKREWRQLDAEPRRVWLPR